MTLRQPKDGRRFFHSGSFSKVRDVVHGLGLSEPQIDDMTDFLENALYDASFVGTSQPSADD